jgi:diguanylate cyclase (GGDEF)-like protein
LPDDHLTASIDADNFKAVNDVGEHISGDKVLTQIGALINKHFPEYFRGREGGEEFHVDFGKIELTPELEARIKAFHDEAARTLSVKWMDKNGTERIESVTLSIGIGKGKNPKTGSLISDRMVYNAKENGRNQIAIEKNKEKTDNISYISGSPVKKEYLSEFSKKQAKAAINELQQSGNLDAGTARRIISEIDGGEAGAPNSGRGVQPQVPPAGTAAAKPAEAVVQPGATGKAVVQQPTNQAGIEGSKPKVGADENAVRAYKSEAERHPDYTQGRFGLGLWKSVNEFVEITPAVSDLIVSGHVNDIPTKFFKIPDALEKIKNYLESHAEWVQTTEGQQAYADIGKNPPKDAGDVADFMDYSPSNEIALRKLLKQTIKKLKTEEENAAAETQAYNEGKTKPPESMPGNENLSFQRTAKVQPEGNQQSLELSPETKPPEVPAITTAKPEQPKQQFSEQTADLFAGTEHAESRTPEQIEADLKAQAERGEVKYRQAQTKGGEAPIEDLPLFQESAGQQELQLQKPEKVSEKKGDAARVQSWVNEGFSGIKDKVVVVQSDTELPQNHVEKIKSEGAEGQIAAVYDNGTGKIYVVADNLPSRGATGRAIMHELFHKGARNMFGAVPGKLGTKLHDVYDDMYSSIPESERKRISDLYLGKGFDANNIKHRFRVVDEVLASRGESAINPTLMQKFLSLLRAALRKMGIVQKYSDNDLLNFIAKAQEAGADIEAKGQPMFKREESVAFKKKTKDEAQQEIFPKEDVEKDLRIFNIAGTDLEPFVKRMMEVDDPDISGILLEQAKRYEPQILESRRGVVSNEETANLARAYSEKVDVQQKLIGRVNAQAWNAHQIAAAMGVVKSATKTLQESAVKYRQKLKEGTLSEKDKADFMRQQALHGMLMLQMLGSRAEAGRALQIFNVFTRVFKEADAMKRIIGEGGQGTKIEKIIEKLSTFDPENTAGINDLLKKPKWRQVLDALYEVWLNSILSAPTTHVVNISSNLATTMLRSVVERPIQAIASKIVGREEPHYLGEGARELYGFISGMKDAWNTFSHSWQTGESLVSGKVEGQQPVSAIEQAFGEKTKRVSKVIRIPTRFLGASDDFFKVLVQRGTLHADAYRTAKILLKKGKINKHQFAAQVKHLVENPTGRMKERAIKEGQYRTFTNDVGKATQYLMDLREMFPPLKLIVPFIKTPTNIAKYALERIPGTIAVKAAMGKINKENIADELAKQTVGAGLAGLAVALSQAGLISGAGPKNKNERESLYRKGWLPYSVLIGDQYYSFARLEPLASTIGLAADFADASKLQQKGAEKKKIINNLMYSIGKNLLSKTYVSSLNNLIDVLSDPDRNAEKFINQMSGSLIPNIIAASARASDDELKQINNLADNILSRIPKQLSAIGVKTSKDVLPKRDIWGETIHTPTTGFEKLLSPIQRSRAVSDKVNEELSSIGFAPSSPSKAVTIDKQKVELTDDEYSRLQQNAGKLAYKTLAEIISNSEYSKLDDEQKKDLLTKYYDNSLAIERNKIMPEILRRIGKIK